MMCKLGQMTTGKQVEKLRSKQKFKTIQVLGPTGIKTQTSRPINGEGTSRYFNTVSRS